MKKRQKDDGYMNVWASGRRVYSCNPNDYAVSENKIQVFGCIDGLEINKNRTVYMLWSIDKSFWGVCICIFVTEVLLFVG